MKRIITTLSLAAALGCGAPQTGNPEPTIKLDVGTATLDLTVSKLKVDKGPLYCALFNSAEGFPGPSPIIDGSLVVDATAETVKCVFAKLPAGTFAVTVYQDENNNGKTDTNAFGAPTEGYGASKNQLPAASPPSFDDNKVTLSDGQTLSLDVVLR